MRSSTSDDQAEELLRPYQSKNPLTKTEIMFYQRLIEALPDLVVLAQVPLSSFLKVDSTQIDPKFSKRWFSPISQQSVDYLICRKDFSIIAAVELDDKTHLNQDAIKRDHKKNHNLAAANVPLIRWHAESMPDKAEILNKVLALSSATPTIQKNETPWLADDQQRYFKYSKKKSTGVLSDLLKRSLIYSLLVVIPIGVVIWVVLSTINHVAHLVQPHEQLAQAAELSRSTTFTTNQPPINIDQQTPTAQQKVAQQQALLREMQAQNQLKKEQAIDLEALKEETWNREFKSKDECSADESMVECGNKHIRNRKRFEAYWDAKKAKL